MKRVSVKILSTTLALAMLIALPLSSLSCLPEGKAKNITGIWEFKLKPLFDYDESKDTTRDSPAKPEEHKAKDKTSKNAKLAEYEVWLYEDGGAVIGFCGPFHFQGERDGNKVRLDVLQAGGEKELSHEAHLELKIVDSKTMSGRSMDSDLGHEHRGLGLSDVSAKRIKDAPPLKSLSSPDWYAEVIKIITKIDPARKFYRRCYIRFAFMGATIPKKNGGGYYLMGDHGPGSKGNHATWTAYYPLDWGSVGARKYHFTIEYAGKQRSIDTVVKYLQEEGIDASLWLGYGDTKDDLKKLTDDVKDFYNKYGDFAISLAVSDYSLNYGIYINLKDTTHAKEAKGHRLIKKLKSNLYHKKLIDGKEKDVKFYIYSGHDVEDWWMLYRPAVIIDGKGLHFMYLIGTAKVHYD